MKQFELEIITPNGCLYEGKAEKLTVNTTEGPICILAGHIDYFAKIEKGKLCAVCTSADKEISGVCDRGVMSVTGGRVKVSVFSFENK